MDPEPELIEQVALQQSLTERTMAVYDKVLAVLPLEPGRLGRDITPDDRRVVPIGPFQGGREDVLADLVHSVGVVAASSRPNPREYLVCPPSHQQRVARHEHLHGILMALLVEVAHGPEVGGPDDAVERHQG